MCHWLGMLRPALVAHTDALGAGNAVRTKRSEVIALVGRPGCNPSATRLLPPQHPSVLAARSQTPCLRAFRSARAYSARAAQAPPPFGRVASPPPPSLRLARGAFCSYSVQKVRRAAAIASVQQPHGTSPQYKSTQPSGLCLLDRLARRNRSQIALYGL